MKKTRRPRAMLSSEQVAFLLTRTDVMIKTLAKEWDCDRSTLTNVRRGKSHQHVCPELPRWTADGPPRNCKKCVHWPPRGQCTMEFPEAKEIGEFFANECTVYEELLQPMARGG